MSDMSGRSPIGTIPVLRLGGTSQMLPVPARDPGADGAHPGQGTAAWRHRGGQWIRSSWVDIAWAGFAGLNLAAMRLLPAWQTVPFLAAGVLAGLLANTVLGWCWLDPVVALGIAGLAVREGVEAWHGEECGC
jgi:hypothetical protein